MVSSESKERGSSQKWLAAFACSKELTNMNDKEAKTFYNSKEWKSKRLQILERDHYECQECRERLRLAAVEGKRLYGKDAKIRRATEVHHKRELKDYPELRLDDDNLISLCVRCHNDKHGRRTKTLVKRKKVISEEKW